jgi:hypothetical protein
LVTAEFQVFAEMEKQREHAKTGEVGQEDTASVSERPHHGLWRTYVLVESAQFAVDPTFRGVFK